MSIRRCLLAAASLAALTTTAGLARAAATSPAAVALRVTDLPRGFARTRFEILSNTTMSSLMKIPKKTFDKEGRISGVAEVFAHGSTGLFEVASDVHEYRTAAGAIWDWRKQYAFNLEKSKIATAPGLGDHSDGFTATQSNGKTTYVAYGIDFQKGKYSMTIGVIAVRGSASMNDAARLGRIMLARAH